MVKVNKKKSVNNNNIFKVELEQLQSADNLETTIHRGNLSWNTLGSNVTVYLCLLFLAWYFR